MKLHVGQRAASRIGGVRGEQFDLPLDLVTQTVAILGVRGSGKTNTGVIFAEELLARGQQVVVIDPLDVWWGLRAGSSGKASGIPIVVLGGERGDLPLEAAGGRTVAEFLVEKRASAVLSTRHLSKGDQRRFVTDFAERLYELKGRAKNRTPMHLVIDEADLFAPQRLFAGMERLFGAVDNLVRRGRASGIGVTLITQRAAVLSKDVLTQCEMLVCHRTVGPQDRKAIEAWIEVHDVLGVADEVLGTLHTLERGEAWIWSPGWLGILERVQIRARRTFDSSATPKAGQILKPPRRLTPVDLAGLKVALAETVERAKAEDPRELKRQVADLKRQLAAVDRPTAKVAKADPAAVKAQIEKAVAQALRRQGLAEIEAIEHTVCVAAVGLDNQLGRLRKLLDKTPAGRAASKPPDPLSPAAPTMARAPITAPARSAPPRRDDPPAGEDGSDEAKDLGGGKRRMLVALAQRPQGLSARSLGVRSGISVRGGSFGTYLGRLRARGWVDGGRDSIRITEAGLAALGEYEPLPTGRDLFDYWLRQLGSSGKARMLRALTDAWPRPMTAEELGEASGVSTAGGSFGTYLGSLRALELVQGGRNDLRAADELMEM